MNKIIKAVAAVALALPMIQSVHAQLKASKPNIILVMTDDQGYGDLGCHGHPFIKTPNLDKLHSQSLRFTDYHASPTCAPTRAALMSGNAPFKNGITHTILERERMTLKTTTVAQMLKGAGYTTGIFGKWHLGDDDEYQPDKRGFDEVFIHGAGGIGQNFPGTQGAFPGTSYFGPLVKHNGKVVKTEGFCTDVFFKQALGWMKEQKDKPFFAYIATNAPHGPFLAPDNYKKMYVDYVKTEKEQAFFGMITNIDDNMGLVMKKLDEWGMAHNTLLIFTTDNGTALGAKIFNAGMKGQKGSAHEGGSRVPLFMRLPGKIKAGLEVNKMARHYDLVPTLVEFSGGDYPSGRDGRSLVSLIEDPNAKWEDRYTFFHVGRWNKKGADGHWGKGETSPEAYKYKRFAMRSEKWRLVEGKLYDIENDPSETTDVSSNHPEIKAEMMKAYDAWWDEVRPLFVNEDALLNTGKPFIELYKKQNAADGIPNWEEPKL